MGYTTIIFHITHTDNYFPCCLVQAVTFLLCVQEVPGSDLGQYTDHPIKLAMPLLRWIVTGLTTETQIQALVSPCARPGFNPWQRQRIFLLVSVFRPPLRPTQPPIQRVLGVL
jgi:hypothetical protein